MQQHIQTNTLYHNSPSTLISIITPLYNRTNIIQRTLNSVLNINPDSPTFEHIIVDDGSTDNPDPTILQYLKTAPFPVIYIKKQNGGSHSARNAAIAHARGQFCFMLDSDDEILPAALTSLLDAWNKIPPQNQHLYREVTGPCINPAGQILKSQIPLHVTKILQQNPWPEPPGVTFVAESIIWKQISQTHKSLRINTPIYIYHTETQDSNIKNFKNKTPQNSINDLFRFQYIANNPRKFNLSISNKITIIARYTLIRQHLHNLKKFPTNLPWATSGLQGPLNKTIHTLLKPLASLALLIHPLQP